MRNTFLVTVALVVVGVLAACSNGGNQGEDLRDQQARDAKALEALYSGVVGKWDGEMSNPGAGLKSMKGQLLVYTMYIADGSNPDGSVRLRPTLRGRFQPSDYITNTDFLVLSGDYNRDGRLVMASGTASTGAAAGGVAVPSDAVLSIAGSAAADKMQVQISRKNGVWGNFIASRVTRVASAPAEGDAAEIRARYVRILGPIEGRYNGVLDATEGTDYVAELSMVLAEVPGYAAPELVALYRRLEGGVMTIEWKLAVDYDTQTGEVFMRNTSGVVGGGAGGGASMLSISGVLSDVGGHKVLTGTVRDATSVLGTLTVTR